MNELGKKNLFSEIANRTENIQQIAWCKNSSKQIAV